MKKYVLFYLTGLTSIWIMDNLLSGIKVSALWSALIVGIFISFSIWFTEYLVQQLIHRTMLIFFVIGVIVMFFVLYLASLLVPGFSATAGSLIFFVDIGAFDSILTLLFGSIISMGIAYLTNWATIGL